MCYYIILRSSTLQPLQMLLGHHVHKEDPVTTSIKTADDLGIEPISHINTESNLKLHMWQLISTFLNGLIFFFAIRALDFFTNAPEKFRDMVLLFGVLASALLMMAFFWFTKTKSAKLALMNTLFCLFCSGAIVMASESQTVPVAWFFLIPILMVLWGIMKEGERYWGDRDFRVASSSLLHWFVPILSISLIMHNF